MLNFKTPYFQIPGQIYFGGKDYLFKELKDCQEKKYRYPLEMGSFTYLLEVCYSVILLQLKIYGWKICTLYFWKPSFVFLEVEGDDDKWECFKFLKSAPTIVLNFYHEN